MGFIFKGSHQWLYVHLVSEPLLVDDVTMLYLTEKTNKKQTKNG